MNLQRVVTWRMVIFFLLFSFILQYLLMTNYLNTFLDYSSGMKNPDQLFWYSDDWLKKLYASLGRTGRSFYIEMLLVDFLYILFSCIGYTMLLYLLTRDTVWSYTSILPVFVAVFDVTENAAQLILLSSYPQISTSWMLLSKVSSLFKLSLALVGFLLIAIFIFRNAVIKFKSRLQNK